VLDSDSLRRTYPHLAPNLIAGLAVSRAGGIDTVALGRAMLSRAESNGTRVVRGRVTAVDTPGGRVRTVRIEREGETFDIRTDRLINAGGPFAGDVAAAIGEALPMETVLRQKVVLEDPSSVIPRDAPFTIAVDPVASSVAGVGGAEPLRGGIHVKPDDTAGPTAIKLGWALDQTPTPPAVDVAVPLEFVDMVVRGATTFIPDLARYVDGPTVIAHGGGFYARTADGRPLIGATATAGSFVITALAGFGAMMACAAGELMADIALECPPQLADPGAFAVDRFEDPAYADRLHRGLVPTGEL
jgi:glycine/D-amino acid oxidase-like deaminating enzyme